MAQNKADRRISWGVAFDPEEETLEDLTYSSAPDESFSLENAFSSSLHQSPLSSTKCLFVFDAQLNGILN